MTAKSDIKVIHEAPPHIPLPVQGYGGTERVVQGLLTGLVKAGVDVTLRCSGDSFQHSTDESRGFHLVPTCERAFGIDSSFFGPKKVIEASLHDLFTYVSSRQDAGENVIVHAHTEDTHLIVAKALGVHSVVTTVHNSPKDWVKRHYSEYPMVSISNAQAQQPTMKGFDYVRTVYNGIDPSLYTPNFEPESDAPLVYLGRIGHAKGADTAVKIALETGNKLILAGPEDAEDPGFFAREIQPFLDQFPDQISYIGEVTDSYEPGKSSAKNELLRNAKAVLFPIRWAEPFGLVMTEAMACGTPVIAMNYPGSSVDEIITDGINGYKVTSVEQAIEATQSIDSIDRRGVYSDFMNRFTIDKMAEGYLDVYEDISKRYLPSLKPV